MSPPDTAASAKATGVVDDGLLDVLTQVVGADNLSTADAVREHLYDLRHRSEAEVEAGEEAEVEAEAEEESTTGISTVEDALTDRISMKLLRRLRASAPRLLVVVVVLSML